MGLDQIMKIATGNSSGLDMNSKVPPNYVTLKPNDAVERFFF